VLLGGHLLISSKVAIAEVKVVTRSCGIVAPLLRVKAASFDGLMAEKALGCF
jgi:hypothetical protein